MFPNVTGQQWCFALGQWGFSIWGFHNFEFAAVTDDQPCPAGAELRRACCFESILERIEAAEVSIDFCSQITGWCAAAAWLRQV